MRGTVGESENAGRDGRRGARQEGQRTRGVMAESGDARQVPDEQLKRELWLGFAGLDRLVRAEEQSQGRLELLHAVLAGLALGLLRGKRVDAELASESRPPHPPIQELAGHDQPAQAAGNLGNDRL